MMNTLCVRAKVCRYRACDRDTFVSDWRVGYGANVRSFGAEYACKHSQTFFKRPDLHQVFCLVVM